MTKSWPALRVAAMALAAGAVVLAPVPAMAQFSDSYEFLEAVKKLDGTKATDLLNDGKTNANTRDRSTGRTALHIVVEARNNTWVSFLLQNGANPNLADNRGVTPLMLAVTLGFLDGAKSLIAGGARVEASNETGETPLITAVHRHDVEFVRLLLGAGANPDRTDNSGRSARDYALLDGRQSPIITAMDNAAKDRAAAAKSKSFGPALP